MQSHLNNDPSVRRAVTDRKARTRDFRLARRQAIRSGDRLGAAMIGEKAAGQGFNLHGIGRYGEEQNAAARSLAGTHTAQAQLIQGLRGSYTGQGSGGTPIGTNQGSGGTPIGINQRSGGTPIGETTVTTGAGADGGKTGLVRGTPERFPNESTATIGANRPANTTGYHRPSGQTLGSAVQIGAVKDKPTEAPFSMSNWMKENNIPTIGESAQKEGLSSEAYGNQITGATKNRMVDERYSRPAATAKPGLAADLKSEELMNTASTAVSWL